MNGQALYPATLRDASEFLGVLAYLRIAQSETIDQLIVRYSEVTSEILDVLGPLQILDDLQAQHILEATLELDRDSRETIYVLIGDCVSI